MDDLLIKISHYGYPGLFAALMFGIVGLPIPDETLLVFFGYLVWKGSMHMLLTWLTAILGSCSGITTSYFIGRYGGFAFVHRYGRFLHLTEDRLLRVQSWFDRVGHWLLTIGYFIPGVRHLTALIAGTSCISFRSFALFAYPGAVLWVSTFLTIGYLVGENWKKVFTSAQHEITAAVLVGLIVAGGIWYWLSRRKSTRP